MVGGDARYVPEKGDIVWISFTPHAGHEQARRRPAMVLSPGIYDRKSGLALFCPITATPAENAHVKGRLDAEGSCVGYQMNRQTPAGMRPSGTVTLWHDV